MKNTTGQYRATSPPISCFGECFKNSVLDTVDKTYFDMYLGDAPSPYKREPDSISSTKEYVKRLRAYKRKQQGLRNTLATIAEGNMRYAYEMSEALRRRKERVVRLLFFFESERKIA
ncbi:MAG: hypothetical protein IKA43_01430 [Clostridia bacterium]|nr:hypothetical protein [Clostridia bacterium]MBR2296050.1 hypothetical protein [Clostridia bacterium]